MATKKKHTRNAKRTGLSAVHTTWKGKRVYKVLQTTTYMGGPLANGPRGRYSTVAYKSLPKDGKPSKWYRAEGELEMCINGYHLTTEPKYWYKQNTDIIFEAEYQGEVVDQEKWALSASEAKTCHRAIRLTRQVWLNDKSKPTRVKPKAPKA